MTLHSLNKIIRKVTEEEEKNVMSKNISLKFVATNAEMPIVTRLMISTAAYQVLGIVVGSCFLERSRKIYLQDP